MAGENIKMSKEVKILGLIIDDKLTFNSHVAQITKKTIDLFKRVDRAAKTTWGIHPEITRTVYTAVVEPITLYAAAAWAPAGKKLSVQAQLKTIQRKFAQKIIGSYRTVSYEAATVLAGLLPLDLRLKEAAALYETRKHGTLPELKDIEVEKKVPYTEGPHPAKALRTGYTQLHTEEEIAAIETETKIFTDGSKIEGKTGAAVVLIDDGKNKTKKYKLANHCSVYQAELLAINSALEVLGKSGKRQAAILSDSRSALEAITSTRTKNRLAHEARKKIESCREAGQEVQLYWVKAHAGLQGNEAADTAAKEAALNLKCKPHYNTCPISYVKRLLREKSKAEWQTRYQNSENASVTKIFFSSPEQAYRAFKNGRLTNKLTQMLTGHGGFSEYLHRFKCKGDPTCPCDQQSTQDVRHCLLECPRHALARLDLEQVIGTGKITMEDLSQELRCTTAPAIK
ncbi:uncharacterized protein LOC125061514 [Pieris napi]|uniref:uncharacterized protein LOC125061514 n=1 Tax=Pieris napi TaxID=78633 RepID=UPI001FB90AD4|nr:uncharacterized protein LOC125061514 [Pieris napi]